MRDHSYLAVALYKEAIHFLSLVVRFLPLILSIHQKESLYWSFFPAFNSATAFKTFNRIIQKTASFTCLCSREIYQILQIFKKKTSFEGFSLKQLKNVNYKKYKYIEHYIYVRRDAAYKTYLCLFVMKYGVFEWTSSTFWHVAALQNGLALNWWFQPAGNFQNISLSLANRSHCLINASCCSWTCL